MPGNEGKSVGSDIATAREKVAATAAGAATGMAAVAAARKLRPYGQCPMDCE